VGIAVNVGGCVVLGPGRPTCGRRLIGFLGRELLGEGLVVIRVVPVVGRIDDLVTIPVP
jgi:hypothetical protein